MKTYFLITWPESGDEIHFVLMDKIHQIHIENSLEIIGKYRIEERKISNSRKILSSSDMKSLDHTNKLIEYILNNKIEDFYIQNGYFDIWPFKEYEITTIIQLPELGC